MLAGPKGPVGKYGQAAPPLAVRHLCPSCLKDPPNIIEEYSSGDLVCGDCGTILGDRIVDTRSEWRTFAGDEGGDDPSRVGNPTNALLGNRSLETSVSARDGRTGLSKELQRATARASNMGNISGKSSTAQLEAAFNKINDVCSKMNLPSALAQRAHHAYQIADEDKLTRGRNDDALMSAAIIFACRAAGAERSFSEVIKVTRVTKSELGKAFTLLKASIKRRGLDSGQSMHSNANNSSEGLLGRFINYLDLPKGLQNSAVYISHAAVKKAKIDGRSPLSIAAGVLYFTTILFETNTAAREIAGIAGVSESTIKLICKKVAEEVDQVIRPEWKAQYPEGYQNLKSLGQSSNAVAKGSRSGTPTVKSDTPTKSETPTKADTPLRAGTPSPDTKDSKSKSKDGKSAKGKDDGKDSNGKAK